MDQAEILQVYEESGALLKGHFLLTSGLHSDRYFEKFAVLQHPVYTERLCKEIARRFEADGVEVVIGPAVGGILLAHEVAKALGTRAHFTEREGGRMLLRRGFSVAEGERVLVVEDVVTTGGSVREVIECIEAAGGRVVGVGVLLDRSAAGAGFGVKTEALLRMPVAAYRPDECPLCKQGVPFTSRGSRHIGGKA